MIRKRKYPYNREMENNSHWKGGIVVEPGGRVLIRRNKKYVYRYRLVMEEYLQRPLLKKEIVHHINGIINDDRIENLKIMSQSDHAEWHGYNTSDEINKRKGRTGVENGFYGKHHSAKTLLLLSKLAKKRTPSRLNTILTEETKKKISETLKSYNALKRQELKELLSEQK